MLSHSYLCRDATLSGRTLTLACVPFDVPSPVSDNDTDIYIEQFDRGAFSKVVRSPNRTSLFREHNPDSQVTTATLLREDSDYLVGVFELGAHADGDRVIADVNDDRVGGVSVGFVPGDHDGDNETVDGVMHRRRVKSLREVSLVSAPAYNGTGVLSLRAVSRAVAVARERERWRWRTFNL